MNISIKPGTPCRVVYKGGTIDALFDGEWFVAEPCCLTGNGYAFKSEITIRHGDVVNGKTVTVHGHCLPCAEI